MESCDPLWQVRAPTCANSDTAALPGGAAFTVNHRSSPSIWWGCVAADFSAGVGRRRDDVTPDTMIAELDDRGRLLPAGRMGVHALGTPGARRRRLGQSAWPGT
ncbi:hypothetical protein [Streptomyces sp. NPDC001275]